MKIKALCIFWWSCGFFLIIYNTLSSFTTLAHNNSTNVQRQDRFQLLILKQDLDDLKLGNQSDGAFPKLQAAQNAARLFVIGLPEIDSYDWTKQSITLTESATVALLQALPSNQSLKEPIRKLKNLKEHLGWKKPIESELYIKAFVVTANSEFIYGGIFLDPTSQRLINYPVIRAKLVDNKAVLNILPVHMPFFASDPGDQEVTILGKEIAPEAAKDWSHFPKEMKSAFKAFGDTANAKELRHIIRNPQIREIVLQAGKLKE